MTSLRSGVKVSFMKKIGLIGSVLCFCYFVYQLGQGATALQAVEPVVIPLAVFVVIIIIGIIREKKMTMEEKMNRERD